MQLLVWLLLTIVELHITMSSGTVNVTSIGMGIIARTAYKGKASIRIGKSVYIMVFVIG